MTEETKAKIRRYNSNIAVSGRGVFAFGVWTAIKTIISVMFNITDIRNQLRDIPQEEIDNTIKLIYITMFVMCLLVLLIHGYVGISAVRYGRGRRKSKKFRIGAVILVFITISFIISDITSAPKAGYVQVAEFVADCTLLFMLIDMLYSMSMARLTVKREQG
ncbi:MAG: hypothetical protein K6E70_10975 [Butyrivibrio sp.]|nr:hypothetical protein [Butyrivibrio sp.]